MKLNEYFDHVYLINLPEAKERLTNAMINCAKVGITFSRWNATSGKEDFIVMNKDYHEGWNRNASALAYTTIKILEDAKTKGYSNIFIMEDDIDFIPNNFEGILTKALTKLPKNWDFFHLNATHQNPSKWISSNLHKLKGAWCCQAYGINGHMYDRYITELSKFNMPIDNITLNLHIERKNSYCTVPNIAVHVPGKFSTLRETLVEY